MITKSKSEYLLENYTPLEIICAKDTVLRLVQKHKVFDVRFNALFLEVFHKEENIFMELTLLLLEYQKELKCKQNLNSK